MQPNDPNQQPIDYLEQISTDQGNTGWPMKTKIIGGVCLVLLLAIVGWMIFSPKKSSTLNLSTLYYRIEVNKKITDVGGKNIRDEDLLKLNSEIVIFLSNFSHDVGVEITGNPKKRPPILAEVKKQEDIKKFLDELNDARLAGRFDEKFRSVLQIRLESIDDLAKSLEKNSEKKKTKELLRKKRQELKVYYDRLNKLESLKN